MFVDSLPTRCVATSRSTGERCKMAPMRGTTVCRKHGGKAPQVQRKAQQRIALAEALTRGERRHPWLVLLDALHAADVLAQEARVKLSQNENITPAQIDDFVDAIERAARMAKVTLDAKALEFATKQSALDGERIASVLREA